MTKRKNKSELKEKSKSEIIEDFLNLIKDSDCKLKFNNEEVTRCDKLSTDIDHKLELQDLSYHQYAQLGKMQAACQQERRIYKNEVEEYEPIAQWLSNNKQAYNSLTKMLGEVRKQEKYHADRNYMPRVMTLEEWKN